MTEVFREDVAYLTAWDGTRFQVLAPEAFETRTVYDQVTNAVAETVTVPVQIGVIMVEVTDDVVTYNVVGQDADSGLPIVEEIHTPTPRQVAQPVMQDQQQTVTHEVTTQVPRDEQVALPRQWDEAATSAALAAYTAANPPPPPAPSPPSGEA